MAILVAANFAITSQIPIMAELSLSLPLKKDGLSRFREKIISNDTQWWEGEKEMGVKLEINQQRCDSNVITNSVLPVHLCCRIFNYQVNINRFKGNI